MRTTVASLHWLARIKKIVRGGHDGYCDLFAPIVARGKVVATLVTGPFATVAPTSSEILVRWTKLTGRKGHLSDPEFAAYLTTTLSFLVLDGAKAKLFTQLVDCIAQLMAGQGQADRLTNRVEALRAELEAARFAERNWENVHDLVDERFQRVSQHGRMNDLRDLGLTREADHLLVALAVNRSPSSIRSTKRCGDMLSNEVRSISRVRWAMRSPDRLAIKVWCSCPAKVGALRESVARS